nr:hypothetical protein [Tanacetum cinerariifolium]
MLDKTMYDSWKIRMELYIEKRENGRMILNSAEENGKTRKKKYEELSAFEKLQADCVLKVTNIVIRRLPLDVYAIFNHHKDMNHATYPTTLRIAQLKNKEKHSKKHTALNLEYHSLKEEDIEQLLRDSTKEKMQTLHIKNEDKQWKG